MRFWLGLSAWELGETEQAQQIWQQLLSEHPFGYYGWRASERLQQAPRRCRPRALRGRIAAQALGAIAALGIPVEAWEQWRTQRGGQPPESPKSFGKKGSSAWGLGSLDRLGATGPGPATGRR